MIGEKKIYIISSVVLAITAAICLIFSMQVISKGYVSLGGYRTFRVVTGSMEPTISTGAILLCKDTEIEQIKKGDIVCYRSKAAEIYGSTVTHRVVAVQKDEAGTIYLETRGDANFSSDPHLVEDKDLIGKVTWYSGKDNVLNDILSFLTGKVGFLLCIVFPVLLVAGLIMQSSVQSLREDLALVREELAQSMKEEKETEQPEESELLPGYTTLTYADYNAIYEALKRELLEELDGRNQEKNTTADCDSDHISIAGSGFDICDDSSMVYECCEDQRSGISDRELGI